MTLFWSEIGSVFEEPGGTPPTKNSNNRSEKLGTVKSLQKVTLTAIKHSSKVRKCLIIYHFTKEDKLI